MDISTIEEQLEIILEDLFLGGSETTGTFLTWSVLFMVQNPDVQAKLRKEICGKLGNRTELLQSIELKKYDSLHRREIIEIFGLI